MKRFWIIICSFVLIAVLAPTFADAAAKEKKKRYDKVSSVDPTAGTVTLIVGEKEDSKEFKVDSFTKIIVKDKPGKLSEVQPDMKASYTPSSDGKKLMKLEVTDPPVEKEKKK